MALCCIGGVCIPYSAIIPLLIYGLQWLVQKLVTAGLLPDAVIEALSKVTWSGKQSEVACGRETCAQPKNSLRRGKQTKVVDSLAATSRTSSCCSNVGSNVCTTIASEEEWTSLIGNESNAATIIICKFTATWCKPCKEIQPLFESLAVESQDSCTFIVVDVDELDEVSSSYKVSALPTFIAIQRGTVLGKYSGSDENKLRAFVESVGKKAG